MTDFEPLDDINLIGSLEALLFVASGPVPINQLAEVLGKNSSEIEAGLRNLGDRYEESGGLSLQWQAGKVQLTTSARLGALIERFLGLEAYNRMSKAALETLAVISYQQPVTKPHIDSIRGVNCDGVVKTLLSKGFIQEVGRSDGPGRPILYGTTGDFLQYFGINSIKDLPPLDESFQSTLNSNNHPPVLKD